MTRARAAMLVPKELRSSCPRPLGGEVSQTRLTRTAPCMRLRDGSRSYGFSSATGDWLRQPIMPGPLRSGAGSAAKPLCLGRTQAYVKITTGTSAEAWAKTPQGDLLNIPADGGHPCAGSVAASFDQKIQPSTARNQAAGAPGGWVIQLVGDASEPRALAEYNKMQRKFPVLLAARSPLVLRTQLGGRGSASWFRVRVAELTRDRATQLCAQLQASGGRCLVLKN